MGIKTLSVDMGQIDGDNMQNVGLEQTRSKSLKAKILEVIWDGERSEEERRLVQRLDIFVLSWATYGYFIRLLDSGNITNAYISGMKEDLHFHGDQYNLISTFFTVGYLCGQIPSQVLLTKFRPSYYLPIVELLWTVVTFSFAAVQTTKQVFGLRFVIGVLESPFAVGVLTVMGSWYTEKELAKRIAIFYSASYAASMFSGYLEAGIYKGMDGHLGLAGWRWLFIFCGVISVPAPLWGLYAIPDNPYTTRARWLNPGKVKQYIARMQSVDRRAPVPLTWVKVRKIFSRWPLYVVTLMLICQCIVTQPLNYFSVWLKSLDRFSVYQINLFPTAAQALGLVTTLAYAWISDALGGKRWQVMCVPAILNFIGMIVVVSDAGYGATFFGYLINAASWGMWPVTYAWVNEICHKDAEERAIVIGVAQTFGQAFIAWVPVVILNTGKYAPKFTLGFTVMSVISVGEFAMIFVILYFVTRDERKQGLREIEPSDEQNSPSTSSLDAEHAEENLALRE
ncbi:Pantothenate transporter liz1 [Lachnellula cervina]|uniref:Pantothenate transporter liz1 n=1 Tax=Lachnellula cervina TaxID=1316786 RepID=A0A7D8Z009_9HELO|nr:Pantothenate transporter liz1 [Lachnellula cervina]